MNVEEMSATGAPVAKFPEVGAVVKGKVLSVEENQQTDYDTGEPIVYKDSGKPAMQYVFTLQTDQHDPAIDGDDGQRRVFAKGQMRAEIVRAVKEAQKTGSVVGGTLTVKFSEEKPSVLKNGRPGNPQKIYKARFEPATEVEAAEW